VGTGSNKLGIVPLAFQQLVVTIQVLFQHLTAGEVTWLKRIVSDTGAPEWTIFSLHLKRVVDGEVPKYSALETNVLYHSLNPNFPFCDCLFKDEENLFMCIQISVERDGKRKVEESKFHRLGLGRVDERSLRRRDDPAR
jgi:hypothetical protein